MTTSTLCAWIITEVMLSACMVIAAASCMAPTYPLARLPGGPLPIHVMGPLEDGSGPDIHIGGERVTMGVLIDRLDYEASPHSASPRRRPAVALVHYTDVATEQDLERVREIVEPLASSVLVVPYTVSALDEWAEQLRAAHRMRRSYRALWCR